MKRMVAAAVLAVIIHTAVFWLVEDVNIRKSIITVPVPKIVTVTMSYRAPAAPQEKKIDGAKKKQPPRKTNTPKKPTPPSEDLIKPVAPEPKPEKIEQQVTEEKETPDEDNIADGTSAKGPTSSTHGNSISNMTAQVEAVPLYNKNPPPKYPRTAIKRGYQGTTELMVLVNKNGSVDDLWLFESSGYSILDEVALQSVKNWLFTPGKKGDRAIEMWVRVPVRFQLQ